MDIAYYLELLLILGVATALAWWCGWGIARLATPPSLREYRGPLAPLLGYALVVVTGYWAVSSVLGLRPFLALLLPITGTINLLAWQRMTNDQRRMTNGDTLVIRRWSFVIRRWSLVVRPW